MCHRYRRVRGEEELGRLSRGGSSSSSSLSLSIPSPGLALLEGLFFFFLPRPLRIQNGYMFICTYVTLSKLTQERKDTQNWWLPFLLLREGRNRFVQPDSLVFVWVFLVGYSCFSSYCQQHFVNAVSWENNQSWALQLGFFEFPQTSQGNCWDILSVMGKHQVCAPLYGWHDLG